MISDEEIRLSSHREYILSEVVFWHVGIRLQLFEAALWVHLGCLLLTFNKEKGAHYTCFFISYLQVSPLTSSSSCLLPSKICLVILIFPLQKSEESESVRAVLPGELNDAVVQSEYNLGVATCKDTILRNSLCDIPLTNEAHCANNFYTFVIN